MSNFRTSLKSICAGWITAAVLFAVMWWQVGRHYAVGVDKGLDGILVIFMFYDCLLLVTISIAFVSGMAVGFVKVEGRLGKPAVRAAAAYALFGSAAALAISSLTQEPQSGALVSHPSFWDRLLQLIILPAGVCALAPFSFFFAPHFSVAAIVGGVLGDMLLRAEPRGVRVQYAVSVILVLGLILIQSWFVHSALEHANAHLTRIQANIDKNLIVIPKNNKWETTLTREFAPIYTDANCGDRSKSIYVKFNKDDGLVRANAHLMAPKDVQLKDKAEVWRFLGSQGVRKPILTKLKYETGSGWEARSGIYTVFTSEYYERND